MLFFILVAVIALIQNKLHHEQRRWQPDEREQALKHGALWTVLFAVVSLFWIFPIVLVLINSFKQKAYISKNAFSLPAGKGVRGT